LTLPLPEIVEAILRGQQPAEVTGGIDAALSGEWDEQSATHSRR